MACMLGVAIIVLMLSAFKYFKYHLEVVYDFIMWYKWLFWLCELLFFPALFNVIWTANCHFYSQRDAIVLANCTKDMNPYPQLELGFLALAFAIAVFYNAMLIWIIEKSKISV